MPNTTTSPRSTPRGSVAGTVTGIYTAERAAARMERHTSVDLIAGRGIAGDRYAVGRGFWSDPVWQDQELTLIESEVVEALGLQPGESRRNIETAGVQLETLIGATFEIGNAELTGVRPCDPCLHLDELTHHGTAGALGRRGGLRARIVRGGRISTGDPIVVSVAQATREG